MTQHRSFVAHVRKIAKWEPVQPRPDTDSVKLCSLFDQIVAMDLEGIVCKRKDSQHNVTEKPSRYWIKVQLVRRARGIV